MKDDAEILGRDDANDLEAILADPGRLRAVIKDELTLTGGREEEILKGRQVVEEKVDARVALGAVGTNFDANCRAAALTSDFKARSRLTPDAYVYTRARQEWEIYHRRNLSGYVCPMLLQNLQPKRETTRAA